jgi:hypothetical protein
MLHIQNESIRTQMVYERNASIDTRTTKNDTLHFSHDQQKKELSNTRITIKLSKQFYEQQPVYDSAHAMTAKDSSPHRASHPAVYAQNLLQSN